jgi:hypothetical protein
VSTLAGIVIPVRPARQHLQPAPPSPAVPVAVTSPSADSEGVSCSAGMGPKRSPPPPHTRLKPASQARFRSLGSSRSASESPN